MHFRDLNEAPSANDYMKAFLHDESSSQSQQIVAGDLTLTAGGVLQVGHQTFDLQKEARKDLAKVAHIPSTYFEEIDPELRAINFNHRLSQFVGRDETLGIVSNDNAVLRVRQLRFGQIPASQVVEALLDAAPRDTVSNEIRVVEYERDNRFDVAIVSRGLQIEPRRGDVVCGGVHLTIEENGAIQVGPESFRLVCMNGAMARVCAGGQHRLRRGQGRNSERKFIETLRDFGRTAWSDWEHVKRGLDEHARKPLDRSDIGHIIQGLRQSPFFISARAASRVEDQLRSKTDDLTFYDLPALSEKT